MADIRLSEQDIDYISRVVATEVPASVRRNPMEYNRMVGAVVDTVTNRLASGRYGSSVKEVLNQNRAFSKITGPKRLDPYGSVEATPVAPKFVQTAVNDYVAARAAGKPSEIKGGTDYANPFHSDASNLRKWVNPMIAKGAEKIGLGKAVHYHGNAPGSKPAPDYNLVTPAGFMPSIESDMRYQVGVPIPTPRQPMALMAQAKAADRQFADRSYNPGGIVNAPKVPLNLVPSANAGEMPQNLRSPLPAIQERIRPMPTSALAKTSTGVGYSLPKAQPTSPIVAKSSGPQTLYNRSGGAANDFRPMPTGPLPQRVSSPVQSTPAPRYNPLPSGPVAPQKAQTVSPQMMAAAYNQYAQTRMSAPVTPMQANPVVTAPRIQATGTAGAMTTPPIAGPLANQGITPATFPPAPPKPTMQQKAKGALQNMLSPENLKKVGGSAIGSALGGPIGGVIGGLLAGQMGNKGGQGILGNLAKSIGPSNYNNPLQSTYIGNGVNAVSNAMWGNRRGDTATYNSQGGGSVTNLGGGQYQRTSNKYGFTEIVNADGSRSTVSTKKK